MREETKARGDLLLDGRWLRIVNSGINVVGGDVNMLGGQINGLRAECAAQPPSAPKEGMIFFSTADREFYGFDGLVWKPLSLGGAR